MTILSHHREDLVALPSGPILSKFLQESPALQVLKFYQLRFKEEHCRALATLQRTDLKVQLSHCTFDPQDAEDTFIEWFRHNRVVTELDRCNMEGRTYSALSGNTSVKKLTIDVQRSDMQRRVIYHEEIVSEEIASLLEALPGNMGIQHLTICDFEMIEDILLFRSLSTHPRIKLLSLRHSRIFNSTSPSTASRSTAMNAILQMLYLNTVVQIIEFPYHFNNKAVYLNFILPRLTMNRSRFEVQRQAVKRADPSIRPQLLGRALHVVRYNSELVFQFLSENVPAFVRTEEEEVVGDSALPLQNESVIISGQKRKTPP